MTAKDMPLPEHGPWLRDAYTKDQMYFFAEQYAAARCAELEATVSLVVSALEIVINAHASEFERNGWSVPTWCARARATIDAARRTEVKP